MRSMWVPPHSDCMGDDHTARWRLGKDPYGLADWYEWWEVWAEAPEVGGANTCDEEQVQAHEIWRIWEGSKLLSSFPALSSGPRGLTASHLNCEESCLPCGLDLCDAHITPKAPWETGVPRNHLSHQRSPQWAAHSWGNGSPIYTPQPGGFFFTFFSFPPPILYLFWFWSLSLLFSYFHEMLIGFSPSPSFLSYF